MKRVGKSIKTHKKQIFLGGISICIFTVSKYFVTFFLFRVIPMIGFLFLNVKKHIKMMKKIMSLNNSTTKIYKISKNNRALYKNRQFSSLRFPLRCAIYQIRCWKVQLENQRLQNKLCGWLHHIF